MSIPARRTLLTLSICLAWALVSTTTLLKYLHQPKSTAAIALALILIAAGMSLLTRLNQRPSQISSRWLLLLFTLFLALFAILYPISLTHPLNQRSDREDALRIELSAIQHHQYPYDTRTFLNNPPTPLPGSLLLAAPFYAIGHIAWQNILWTGLFFLFAIHFFRYRATALFCLTVFLLCVPANLSDLTSGGDYLVNFFYAAIAVTLLVRTLNHPLPKVIPCAIFLGIALSSRILYAFIFLPFLALVLQRTTRARAILLLSTTLATAAAITIPIFTPHPLPHLLQQLNQNAVKLRYIPAALHPQWTLPLLAAIAACAAFRIRMDLPRVFLLFSIAGFLMLAPFVLTFALHSEKFWNAFSWLSVPALAFSLWALSQYEAIQPLTPQPSQ